LAPKRAIRIRDREEIEPDNAGSTLLDVLGTVYDLRESHGSNTLEWAGWSVNIVDQSGRTITSIPLRGNAQ